MIENIIVVPKAYIKKKKKERKKEKNTLAQE